LKKWDKQSEDLDETIRNASNTIIREVEDLKKLVDEFTKFGKMPQIERREANVRDILEEVIGLYSQYKDVNITMNVPDSIPDIELDPEQIKRVIINLFDNAVNAMEARGEIIVAGEFNGRGDVLTLDISDTGKGIDENDMDKLFLPYFSTKKDGTGLGLAISHMIISKHGGTISASNNDPKGAKFTIKLPA